MAIFEDCPFCSPEEIGWRIVKESDLVLSLLSNPRLVKGNTLVIPKRHIEPPETLTDPEKVAVFDEIERLTVTMLNGFALGVDVFQKTRPYVEQGHNGTKVNHLHFHVLPSNPNSELYDVGVVWARDRFSPLTHEEAEEIIPKLQKDKVV